MQLQLLILGVVGTVYRVLFIFSCTVFLVVLDRVNSNKTFVPFNYNLTGKTLLKKSPTIVIEFEVMFRGKEIHFMYQIALFQAQTNKS